jgi:hypothetical protein
MAQDKSASRSRPLEFVDWHHSRAAAICELNSPPEPWRSFFAAVDANLTEDVHLHCCGGFVVTQLYGVARTTSDVDFLCVVPNVQSRLTEIAGKGSPLHRKYKLYLDAVTVATPPEDYEQRLVPMFPGNWVHLRLIPLFAAGLHAVDLCSQIWEHIKYEGARRGGGREVCRQICAVAEAARKVP